ncbi:Sm-like ribonucleoprotein [Neurospora tetrasperma FGSC 2509]|nr:Sm-like ribonucleoprotein [Neurospora tetrasperma FGSC 2509]
MGQGQMAPYSLDYVAVQAAVVAVYSMMQRGPGYGISRGARKSGERRGAFSVLHHVPSLADRQWLDEAVEDVEVARQRLACAASKTNTKENQFAPPHHQPTSPRNNTVANMTSTIGIPIKLLNEAQGHIVTLEITSGQTYRGKLIEAMLTNALPPKTAEDNMNVQLKDITVTARDGRVSHLEQVYIRGSHVRFFIVPDMLRNAPMFRSRNVRGRGVGLARGRATVSRARAGGRGGAR